MRRVLVSVPADPNSKIRNFPNMTTELTRAEINVEICAIAKKTGLDQAFVDAQIDADATLDQVRAAALEAMQSRTAPNGNIGAHVGQDHSDPVPRRRYG